METTPIRPQKSLTSSIPANARFATKANGLVIGEIALIMEQNVLESLLHKEIIMHALLELLMSQILKGFQSEAFTAWELMRERIIHTIFQKLNFFSKTNVYGLFSIIEILKGGIRMLDGTIRDETEASALTYRQDVIDIYSNRTRSFYRTFL
jgi:hypothetical protein